MGYELRIPNDEEIRDSKIERLNKGIAAYSHERKVLLRLLRKSGSFTSKQFDLWFSKRRNKYLAKRGSRYSMRFQWLHSNTFILGAGINGGTCWARMLNLLQIMIDIGEVGVRKDDGVIVYFLPDQVH